MAKTNAFKKLAVGAAVAGAAGYVVGVLSAPKEGKKTRRELKKTAEHSITDVEKQLKQLHTELGELMSKAKDTTTSSDHAKQIGGALKSANSAKDKLREVLSSIREGQASDKDLKKALEDAKHSLVHLKKFIKK